MRMVVERGSRPAPLLPSYQQYCAIDGVQEEADVDGWFFSDSRLKLFETEEAKVAIIFRLCELPSISTFYTEDLISLENG